jgi:hypothetical protein
MDGSDWLTKRALSVVMFFVPLADPGTPDRLPMVAIPAK